MNTACSAEAPKVDRKRPASPPSPAAPAPVEQPQSIEDQINTSMTQTLEALSIRPPDEAVHPGDDEDDEDDTKRGFFSRFKRS